jgi:hypothetical protein
MTPYIPPYLASFGLLADLFDQTTWDFSAILDAVSLATILAGVFVVTRYREALKAKDAAGAAWREERDAEMAKADRLEGLLSATRETLAETQARVAVLEARPNLDAMHKAIIEHDTKSTQWTSDITHAIRELTDAILNLKGATP